MKEIQMKVVQILTVQSLCLHLIFDVSNVENDSVGIVKAARELCARHVHRNISFLCKEFSGIIVDDLMTSTLILPSLLLA